MIGNHGCFFFRVNYCRITHDELDARILFDIILFNICFAPANNMIIQNENDVFYYQDHLIRLIYVLFIFKSYGTHMAFFEPIDMLSRNINIILI